MSTWTRESRVELSADVVAWWADSDDYRNFLTAPNVLRARVLAEACLDAMHGLPVIPSIEDLLLRP